MGFRISGLPFEQFEPLLGLDTAALAARGVVDLCVEEEHAWPCRVTLQDAVPGERVLLLNYRHQSADSPYASSGPIVVRRHADRTCIALNEVPDQQRRRLLSVRAYDSRHWIVAGDVTPGTGSKPCSSAISPTQAWPTCTSTMRNTGAIRPASTGHDPWARALAGQEKAPAKRGWGHSSNAVYCSCRYSA